MYLLVQAPKPTSFQPHIDKDHVVLPLWYLMSLIVCWFSQSHCLPSEVLCSTLRHVHTIYLYVVCRKHTINLYIRRRCVIVNIRVVNNMLLCQRGWDKLAHMLVLCWHLTTLSPRNKCTCCLQSHCRHVSLLGSIHN